MSKKSAYRRRRHPQHAYALTPGAWNRLRGQLGWPETGAPVPFAECLRLEATLDAIDDVTLRILIAMITEGWRQSYPHPPQAIVLTE